MRDDGSRSADVDASGDVPRAAGARGARRRPPAPGALAVPAYRRYWVSQLVSGTGTWAQGIAQSWLVLQLTGSAVALGTVTMLQFLPMLAFPLFGGVIADRLPRRRLLMVTQAVAMAQALALGVLVATGTVEVWHVAALAFLLGMTNAFGNPAQQALVPEIVGRELVGSAVALNSVQFNVARLAGGALGGITVAVFGIAPTLLLNALSYLPAILVLATLPLLARARTELPAGAPTTVLRQVAAGVRFALGTPPIRTTLALIGIVGLLAFNWSVALPLLAVDLGAGPTGFGALMSGFGAGSLLAGVFLVRGRDANERRLAAGGLALGGTLVLLGLSSWYGVSLALMVLAGASGITATVTANTRLQLLTPDEYRGRVLSLMVLLMGGTTPIGAVLLGAIADAAGIRVGLLVFGALAVGGLVLVLALDRGRSTGAVRGDGSAAALLAADGGSAPGATAAAATEGSR